MAAKWASKTSKLTRVFGQRQEPAKMFRVGLYARVSTHDQQTLPLQLRAMRDYVATGRAMAGLLSVFAAFEHEILWERIRAGIAEARLQGKHLGRPVTVGKQASQIRKLFRAGVSKAEIARRLDISRTSVRRILTSAI
jgi:DNA invertase Pin-like site-specific DNA recombinase